MNQLAWYVLLAATLAVNLAGCEKRAAEQFGKVFYVGGASNLDSITNGVPEGLRRAGYRGDVQTFLWTISFNPLVDQLLTTNAKARAGLLTLAIEDYHRRYPDNEIEVVALSAGTGVAVWAMERLKPNTRIDNVFLLGSSLSHDYDVQRALQHIDGKIHVFYSSHDKVLQAVEIVGTIDGKRGVKSVGQVGLSVPAGADAKIVNTGWSAKYFHYGWAGGHTDCTNKAFVRGVIAPLMLPEPQPDSTPTDTHLAHQQR